MVCWAGWNRSSLPSQPETSGEANTWRRPAADVHYGPYRRGSAFRFTHCYWYTSKRDWILGNRRITADESALSGQIGWEQRGDEPASRYQPETKEWLDVVEPQEHSARAPFVFDGSSRILGVLKHRSFGESTVAKVMQTLLRQGEEQREWPSTEWSVEAILDERDFLSWLHSVQAVTSVKLVTKMPNPDGLDEFGPVWEEMSQRKARLMSTRMVAANEDEGLEGLESDERVRGSLAMGRRGFGYVEARG